MSEVTYYYMTEKARQMAKEHRVELKDDDKPSCPRCQIPGVGTHTTTKKSNAPTAHNKEEKELGYGTEKNN